MIALGLNPAPETKEGQAKGMKGMGMGNKMGYGGKGPGSKQGGMHMMGDGSMMKGAKHPAPKAAKPMKGAKKGK